ncbi:MAG: hypothetical protein DMG46_20045 [Acidobacteria bacterium]|nr:MAG: hypothetical protein DMG46_20045 [Acidobacteriota bacterium]
MLLLPTSSAIWCTSSARKREYNEERPHSSLGYRTPQDFATAMRAAEAGSALLAPPSSAADPNAESVV